MRLLITSAIPNLIQTPDDIRTMVLVMADTVPNVKDYVTELLFSEYDFGNIAFKIYAKNYKIKIKNSALIKPEQIDAILEIGATESSMFERVAKENNIPYLSLTPIEEAPTGIVVTDDNNNKVLLTDSPA